MNKLLILGLTGQSGAGKGVFSRAAESREGVCVLDTDVTSRQVVSKGQPCLDELVEKFGREILLEDGSLDRKRLADVAFSDKEKHRQLNRITHYHIMKKIKRWLEACRKHNVKCAIIDAPLLFESSADKLCDVIVAVIAPYETRLARIMSRDGIDEKSARLRLDSQPDDSFFREKCCFVLENTGEEDCFVHTAEEFIDSLLKD